MIGDEILVEVSANLDGVSENDIVGRFGDDDFGVLLKVDANAKPLIARIAAYERTFDEPVHTGDRDGAIRVQINASIGAAPMEPGASSFEEIVARADVALQVSKGEGGNCATIFNTDLQSLVIERSLERAQILEAMESDAFVLEYQPMFELKTRAMIGAEALVRWRHPTRGLLAPAVFLPTVKREDLLGELTTWVMRRIARDFKGGPITHAFRCYFNVPSSVLESQSFTTHLGQLLFGNPALDQHLGIEITESEAMLHVDRAIEAMKRTRGLGVLVSIDDFGTGYSSLSYLKRLPIDVVKLDKSFITGIPTDTKDLALAKLFLGMTRQFSFVSVGEGIENQDQADWLLAHGCMIGQGDYFAKPMAWSNMVMLLEGGCMRTDRVERYVDGFGERKHRISLL